MTEERGVGDPRTWILNPRLVSIPGSNQVPSPAMDAIKKKMEKLSAETAAAETRIETFERMKEANEAEAEKYEEQLRLVSTIILSVLIFPPYR